jgi:hypothetical protein
MQGVPAMLAWPAMSGRDRPRLTGICACRSRWKGIARAVVGSGAESNSLQCCDRSSGLHMRLHRPRVLVLDGGSDVLFQDAASQIAWSAVFVRPEAALHMSMATIQ